MEFLVSKAESKSPRSTLLVAHGFAEHVGRYRQFATELADTGFDVYLYDFLGHGELAASGDAKHFGMVNVANLIAQSMEAKQQVLREARTDQIALFGHSLGGLVSLATAILDPTRIQSVAVTGPALRPNPQVSGLVKRLGGWGARFFPATGTVQVDPRDLTNDSAEVLAYIDDPVVFRSRVPLLTASSMLVQGAYALKNAQLCTVPTLILHGSEDKVCQLSGSQEFVRSIQASKANYPVELREIPQAKHDLLHEVTSIRSEVTSQLVQWYEKWAVED